MQKRTKNIGVNAILNVIKQGMSVLFPLITYPYALRVLGVVNTGKVNYGNSIISYFSLFAMLGVSTYAVREGSKRKNDPAELETFVDEVFTINTITTILSYIFLALSILLIPKFRDYSKLLFVQSLSIAFTTLGIDWINTIFEDFLLVTIRSIVTHVVSLILLFMFVREPDDIYIYAFLNVVTNGIICFSNWFYCRRYVKIRLTKVPNFKIHLIPLMILFTNLVAVSIYVNVDTTMLGWMKGDYYVGIYTVAVKIYNIVKSMLAAIYMVTVPRLAFYRGNGDDSRYKELNTDLWCYLLLLLIPCGVGLIVLSEEIIQFMGGNEYMEAVPCLEILGVAVIFAIFGGLVTACMNITLGREKDNMIATVISAALNFGLNLIIIPILAQNGAALTTLISEAFVALFCFVRIPQKSKYMDINTIVSTLLHASIGAIFVALTSYFAKQFVWNYMLRMVVIMISSVLIYTIFLYLVKDNYFLSTMKLVKRKLSAKK